MEVLDVRAGWTDTRVTISRQKLYSHSSGVLSRKEKWIVNHGGKARQTSTVEVS